MDATSSLGLRSVRSKLGRLWRNTCGRLDGQYIRLLNAEIGRNCQSVLDVGCGFNSPVQFLDVRPIELVGIDAFEPAIEQSRARGIHDRYYAMDVLQLSTRFAPETFDYVLASDLIEHLGRNQALELINQMETIARNAVILYAPNGFLEQGDEYGNPLQRHHSGWTVQDLLGLGYSVSGVEGWKPLRGALAEVLWRPQKLWLTVSLLSQCLVTRRPRLAFRLFCVKRMSRWAQQEESQRRCQYFPLYTGRCVIGMTVIGWSRRAEKISSRTSIEGMHLAERSLFLDLGRMLIRPESLSANYQSCLERSMSPRCWTYHVATSTG